MKILKLLSLAAFAAGSLGLSSCGCCTGEESVPALRQLPAFKEIPVGEASVGEASVGETPVSSEK